MKIDINITLIHILTGSASGNKDALIVLIRSRSKGTEMGSQLRKQFLARKVVFHVLFTSQLYFPEACKWKRICVPLCYHLLLCVTLCSPVFPCLTLCYSVLRCVTLCSPVFPCVSPLSTKLLFGQDSWVLALWALTSSPSVQTQEKNFTNIQLHEPRLL